MLGKIVGIEDNIVTINLNINVDEFQSLTNLLVSMEDSKHNIIDETVLQRGK